MREMYTMFFHKILEISLYQKALGLQSLSMLSLMQGDVINYDKL